MTLIVAVDQKWGIGRDNDLLFSLPLDLKRFKELTLNSTVVMGYNTMLSLPKFPLKDRNNIVLCQEQIQLEHGEVVTSIDQLLSSIKGRDNVFVIGGASVYEQLEPFCSQALVTKVEADGLATHFFPNLDSMPRWHVEHCSETVMDNGFKTKYVRYVAR